MVARFSAAVLGFLAFTVSAISGVLAGNPPVVVLSRALWAMLLFCIIGLAVGAAAQAVVSEHEKRRHAEVFGADDQTGLPASAEDNSTLPKPEPMRT